MKDTNSLCDVRRLVGAPAGCSVVSESPFKISNSLAGHPLFEKGLGSFGVFEVLASTWVAQLDAQHKAARPDGPALPPQRHFVFTFHDSTLECVADDLVVVLTRDGLNEVITGILPLMREG